MLRALRCCEPFDDSVATHPLRLDSAGCHFLPNPLTLRRRHSSMNFPVFLTARSLRFLSLLADRRPLCPSSGPLSRSCNRLFPSMTSLGRSLPGRAAMTTCFDAQRRFDSFVVRLWTGADFTEGLRQDPQARDTLIDLDRSVEGGISPATRRAGSLRPRIVNSTLRALTRPQGGGAVTTTTASIAARATF